MPRQTGNAAWCTRWTKKCRTKWTISWWTTRQTGDTRQDEQRPDGPVKLKKTWQTGDAGQERPDGPLKLKKTRVTSLIGNAAAADQYWHIVSSGLQLQTGRRVHAGQQVCHRSTTAAQWHQPISSSSHLSCCRQGLEPGTSLPGPTDAAPHCLQPARQCLLLLTDANSSLKRLCCFSPSLSTGDTRLNISNDLRGSRGVQNQLSLHISQPLLIFVVFLTRLVSGVYCRFKRPAALPATANRRDRS